jgi:hypothetical protein
MLGAVVLVTGILGYALFINRLARWPLESSFLFVNSGIICVLLFSGLLESLKPVSQVLLWTGVVLFLLLVLSQWRAGLIRDQISPGVAFFLLSVVGLWMLTGSAYYSSFVSVDDFSHWGRVSKIIASSDRLINAGDAVWFKDYPPGMALFNYLPFQVEAYSERLAMFSQGVFILAALSHLFVVVPRPAGRYIFIGLSGFLYTLLYVHGLGLHTLAVDLALGVIFGASLFGYFTDRQCGMTAAIIRLIPVVMVLPLIKQIGVFFSLVIVTVVVCDIALAELDRANNVKFLGMAALLGFSCMFSYVVWNQHVKNMGVAPTFSTHFTISEVAHAVFSDSASERHKVTVANFAHRLATPLLNGFKKINMQQYLLLLSGAFLLFLWRANAVDQAALLKRVAPIVVLFACFVPYLAILLALYLFSFSAYEGPRLASFDRYANTYLVGLLLVLFGMSLSRYLSDVRSKAATISFLIISLLAVIPSVRGVVLDTSHVIRAALGEQNPSTVENISRYRGVIERYTPPSSRIYFLWQHSAGMELQILSYEAIPRKFNAGCWSIGEPYDDGDVWTCRMTPIDLEKTLTNYDFVFVGHADANLGAILEPIAGFESPLSGSLFTVVNENDHLVVRKVM